MNDLATTSDNRRALLVAGAAILVLIAVLMPTGWYDTIPRELPLPFSGVTLFRLTFLLEALALGFLAIRERRFAAGSYGDALVPVRSESPVDISKSSALIGLTAVMLLGIGATLVSVRRW